MLKIYIWFSFILLPCLAYENYYEENYGNSLITESEFRFLEELGTIEPLLLLILVPLAIAWIGASGFMALIMTGFSYDAYDNPNQPWWFSLPLRFIVFFIGSLFLTPIQLLQNLPNHIQNLRGDPCPDYSYGGDCNK